MSLTRKVGEMGMRLTDEQVMQDNKRFANCNALAELKYCGWDIPHRKSITNDEIHFYAWLCRSAVDLLKERDAVLPIPYHRSDGTIFKYECRKCRTKIFNGDLFCRHCGRPILWKGR